MEGTGAVTVIAPKETPGARESCRREHVVSGLPRASDVMVRVLLLTFQEHWWNATACI